MPKMSRTAANSSSEPNDFQDKGVFSADRVSDGRSRVRLGYPQNGLYANKRG
jgi:hypothetical protein